MKQRNLYILTVSAVIMAFLSGCQSKQFSSENETAQIDDPAAEWSRILQNDGILNADINGDGQDDLVKITYIELEGSRYIEAFELSLAGLEHTFKIEENPYDASFVKMLLYDFDKDNTDEIMLLFDTHGGGGEGTHDLYMLRQDSDNLTGEKISPYVEDFEYEDSSWTIDGIYDIEKVLQDGEEKLLAYQYVWGAEGHSDAVGNMVSEVSFRKESNSFSAEKSWIENRE